MKRLCFRYPGADQICSTLLLHLFQLISNGMVLLKGKSIPILSLRRAASEVKDRREKWN